MAFIVFEGLDGAGKSSLIQNLQHKLDRNRIRYILTREPGGTPLAEQLRELLIWDGGDTPVERTELLLYGAIRAQHVERKIKPALKDDYWVLCDRFTGSTYAFQKGGRGLKADDIHWLNQYATDGLEPDLNVLLDLPVEVSLKRMQERAQSSGVGKDRFEMEKSSFHQRVRDAYLELANEKPEKWLVLNADQNREKILADFASAMKERGLLSD